MIKDSYDVVVIGSGPGGLAAAKAATSLGASVLIIEREKKAGGILNQCIHDGFGLIRYKKTLTGPEYAHLAIQEASVDGIDILTDSIVTSLASNEKNKTIVLQNRAGQKTITASSVVLATGCRERTRGQLRTPGSRPAGVFTAGIAQNFTNLRNLKIGKRVVILGSGDIGLIMARRLTLEGSSVLGVFEIMPNPCGLERNIQQCLYDFNIPITCSMTVTNIIGKDRLKAVEVSKVDEHLNPIQGTSRLIECDTLVLSVGLIPENEIAKKAGVALDEKTNGVITNDSLETSVSGIFACGNCRRVLDLADLVSTQGELAGHNAAIYSKGLTSFDTIEQDSVTLAKGWPKDGVITCTLCPRGCQISIASGTPVGNSCKRGYEYALAEIVRPMRTLTTTMLDANGTLVPVKSKTPVPRDLMFDLCSKLRVQRLKDHKNGQVVFTVGDYQFVSTEN